MPPALLIPRYGFILPQVPDCGHSHGQNPPGVPRSSESNAPILSLCPPSYPSPRNPPVRDHLINLQGWPKDAPPFTFSEADLNWESEEAED